MRQASTTIKKIGVALAIAALALILYVLSSGPVFYMARHKIISDKSAKFVYWSLGPLTGWHPYIVYGQWWIFTKQERELMTKWDTWKP